MANSFQDLTNVIATIKPTIVPSVVNATGNGTGRDVTDIGTNRINAIMYVGAAVALTSAVVKMQAGVDDADYVDIEGAVFETVVAGNEDPQIIDFQLPKSLTSTSSPYNYVRAHVTLVGTSVALCVGLIGCGKWDKSDGWVGSPGTVN